MSIVNSTKKKWNVIDENGNTICPIMPNESVNIRSVAQTENDKKYSPQVKINNLFIKTMIVNERDIIEELMQYPKTYVAWGILRLHISIDNRIVKYTSKGEERYRIVDLAEEMGISRQAALMHINKLKELNAIVEAVIDNKKYFVVNPYCCQKNSTVPKKIIDLFETDKPNFEKM